MFIDGVLVDTTNNTSTVSSNGETVTQTLDAGAADTVSNVINNTNTTKKLDSGDSGLGLFNNLLGTTAGVK